MSNKLQIIQIKRISDENFEGRKRPISTDSYQHRPICNNRTLASQ